LIALLSTAQPQLGGDRTGTSTRRAAPIAAGVRVAAPAALIRATVRQIVPTAWANRPESVG
jgi:hypothetical protein